MTPMQPSSYFIPPKDKGQWHLNRNLYLFIKIVFICNFISTHEVCAFGLYVGTQLNGMRNADIGTTCRTPVRGFFAVGEFVVGQFAVRKNVSFS